MPEDLVMDEDRHEVRLRGRPLDLSTSEYALLATLMRRPGAAVSASDLLTVLRGPAWVDDHEVLQVQVSRLRRKLGESAGNPRYIVTVRGFGYRYEPSPSKPADAFHRSRQVVLAFDADLVLRGVSPHEPFLGWEPEEILGTRFSPCGLDHERARNLIDARLDSGARQSRARADMVGRDGSRVPSEISTSLQVDAQGAFMGIMGTFRFPVEPGPLGSASTGSGS